jgi:hypothetical protein
LAEKNGKQTRAEQNNVMLHITRLASTSNGRYMAGRSAYGQDKARINFLLAVFQEMCPLLNDMSLCSNS